VIDARDSTIEQLQAQLDDERKLKEQLQDQVNQLQKEVAQLGEGLQHNKSVLDEKISALSLARKQLRNTRERNSVCLATFIIIINYPPPAGAREKFRKNEHCDRQATSC